MKLIKSPAKLASNCNKGAWSLFCWALLPCLSNSPLHISSPWNLIVFELSGQDMSRYWIWPKHKFCQILYFFCCRIAASTKRGEAWRKNQEEIKTTSPTLIDKPLCKTGINQRCTFFFLGKRVTCLSAFAPRKRKPCQYYLSSWNPFFLNFHIKDKYWNWSKKHATKSWIPTSHPVHLQLLDSCLDLEGC